MSNQLKGIMEAYSSMVSESQEVEQSVEEACSRSKMKNEKLSSKEKMKRGMYNEKQKLDPVGQEDDDVDNDGDTDSSDKYIKNRRKKVSKAIKKDGEPEVAKIKVAEDLVLDQAIADMFAAMSEAISHTKDAAAPEAHDEKQSPKSKEFVAKHKKSEKDIEDAEEKSHDTVFKAGGKDMKQAPTRGNDNLNNGDKKPKEAK